jgi:predicted phosphodiesterase
MSTTHPHSLDEAFSTPEPSRRSHPSAMGDFDHQHERALKGIWFLGDVHGEFRHIAQALLAATTKQSLPNWLVFLGDVDIDHKPFREILAPLKRNFPAVKVAFICGNHDADTYEHWACLHDCGEAVALHGQVVEMNGVRIAGLGGNFLGRIWSPPGEAFFANKAAAMNRGTFQWRDGQKPNPKLHGAIYPDDVKHLASFRADILVTHEAPSCHPYGFAALDELARSMQVVRSFHGHQHDDRSAEYALVRDSLRFDALAVGYCSIKNGLGQLIHAGPKG